MRIPKIRDESEDFGRDAVDWGDPVPPGSEQAEDFGGMDLKGGARK